MTRNLSKEDASRIRAIDDESFAKSLKISTYKRLLEKYNSFGFWVDGNLAGYVFYKFIEDAALLRRIAVGSKHRNQKIASRLLEKVESEVKNKSKLIKLHIREKNIPAQKFFQKNGYKEAKTEPGFYKNGDVAIVFEKVIL